MSRDSPTPGTIRFTADYQENAVLEDGTPVILRSLRPADAPLLTKGFGNLSADARYMRFFGVKRSLSRAEVAYLTEMDGWNHFAIGAAVPSPSGPEGVGVARFIRLGNDPEAAELAIAVVDRVQGKGLGRILLERLMAAARERHVKRFRFEVLAGNARMLNLVHDVVPDATPTLDGTELHFEIVLGHQPAAAEPRH